MIFSEIGYCAVDGANYRLCNGSVNVEVQANLYQAAFEAVYVQDYFQGIFWWDWSTDPSDGGSNNTRMTPNNKPAASVCKQYFS